MLDTTSQYEIVIFSIGDTKSGTKMGKLQLKKLSDETLMNCILWEEALGRIDNKTFRTGNVVRIANGTYNEKYNNCLISELELIKEAKIGIDKKAAGEIFNKILKYVDTIEDKDLKKYIIELMNEYEEDFKKAPAAKLMHHNYMGGLIVHTFECLEIADKLIELYGKKINHDHVYAACILHDFGKIFEYIIDDETGLIDYNEKFRKDWITHSQWGFTSCMTHGFKEVAKMIAAHHSRTDWGAIIDLSQRDLEPSLYLLHHIDDLSAKYGKITVGDI